MDTEIPLTWIRVGTLLLAQRDNFAWERLAPVIVADYGWRAQAEAIGNPAIRGYAGRRLFLSSGTARAALFHDGRGRLNHDHDIAHDCAFDERCRAQRKIRTATRN